MKAAHEAPPAKRKERSETRAPDHKPAALSSPVFAPQGLTFDGLGNRALLSLLRSGLLQRKARVSQQNDPRERDADRAADAAVANLHAPSADVERTTSSPQPIAPLSGGHHLDPSIRTRMESQFSESFRDVRIHTGHPASQAADALEARAFTTGNHIVFADKQFAPETTAGQRLLAHELAHVVQQRRPDGSAPTGAHEHEADAAARTPGFSVRLASARGFIQRSPRGKKEAVVQVRWRTDSWDMEDAVIEAIANSRGFRGVPEDVMPQAFNRAVATLHGSPTGNQIKPGQKVRLLISANYDRENIPPLTGVVVAFADPDLAGAPKTPEKPRSTEPPPVVHERSGISAVDRDRETMQKLYAQLAAEADRDGYSAFDFVIANNGKELDPISMAKVGERQTRPAGTQVLTQDAAYRELEAFMNVVVRTKGAWKARFTRFQPGAMIFKMWERLPDIPPPPQPGVGTTPRVRSAAEEFEEATGMVYPPRINKALQEIAIQGLHDANPFLLKNLPYTIGGILVPMGAMKLLTTDINMGTIIRIEWMVDEDVVEASQIVRAEQSSATSTALRELKMGDLIETPQGTQRVVALEPRKIVTEPYSAPPNGGSTTGSTVRDVPVTAPKGGTPPPAGTAGENDVWVQLGDGRVRAYTPSEVKGTIKPGGAATTPEGPGRVVKIGEPPHSSQVRHEPFKPSLTPEDLNQPVTMRPGLTGKPRTLNATERANANKIQDVLRRFQEGDEAALGDLANFRAKPLTGDLAGWTELDLLPNNPGALNQMRMLVRVGAGGKIEARLLQMH